MEEGPVSTWGFTMLLFLPHAVPWLGRKYLRPCTEIPSQSTQINRATASGREERGGGELFVVSPESCRIVSPMFHQLLLQWT